MPTVNLRATAHGPRRMLCSPAAPLATVLGFEHRPPTKYGHPRARGYSLGTHLTSVRTVPDARRMTRDTGHWTSESRTFELACRLPYTEGNEQASEHEPPIPISRAREREYEHDYDSDYDYDHDYAGLALALAAILKDSSPRSPTSLSDHD